MLLQKAFILAAVSCLSVHLVKSEEKNCKAKKENGSLNCGRTNATSTRNTSNVRIIPAKEAEKGAWPWMAGIFIAKRNEKVPSCGGALLSRCYVVTAAHCVIKSNTEVLNPKDVTVRLGDHDLKSDKDGMKPINCNVNSINVHEHFDRKTNANDIALLRLECSVDFNNHIQPICLPGNEDQERGQLNGYVAGWGATTYGGPASDVLMEMSALITSDEVCQEAYEGQVTITDVNICSVGVNGSSPCAGFGGSPVMIPGKDNRYHIAGIVSFGRGCGDPKFPDVHTRVSKFLDWIGKYVT